MFRLRKILAILLLFVMLIPFVPDGALVFDAKADSHDFNWSQSFSWDDNYTGKSYLTGKPGVYIMGDGYAIVWVTTFIGTGAVAMKDDNGNTVVLHDERNGIVRTNDTIHVVKVTEAQYGWIQKNGYFIQSREVVSHLYALTNYGSNTVTAGPIKVPTIPAVTDTDLDIIVLTDIHGDETGANGANGFLRGELGGNPDLYVFPGDIVADTVDTKSDVESIFKIMGNITKGQVPAVYARGNHDCHGIVASMLLDYFPTKTGRFYFDFTYGPLWGVVIDTVEDKHPLHTYYGNNDTTTPKTDTPSGSLINYEKYLQEQQKWLRSISSDPNKMKLGIYHNPNLGSIGNDDKTSTSNQNSLIGQYSYAIDITDSIHHLELDFAVAGHTHTACPNFSINNVFHDTLVSGGHVTNGYVYTPDNKNANSPNATITNNTAEARYDMYVGSRVKLDHSNKKAIVYSQYADGHFFGRDATTPTQGEGKLLMNGYEISFPDGSGTRYLSKYNNDSSYNASTNKFNFFNTTNDGIQPTTLSEYRAYINNALPEPGMTSGKAALCHSNWTTSGTDDYSTSYIKIAVQPTVFETGGDWYNVVWVSDYTGYTNGNDKDGAYKGIIGFIQLEYNGETIQIFDEVAGVRRAHDNIHTVRVPKKYLSNNKYFVGTLSVQYQYTNTTNNTGRYYKVGQQYVTSPEYLFMDRTNDKTPNILTYSDLKFPTNKNYGFVKEATDALGTSPTLVVVAGNAVQTTTGNRYPAMEEVVSADSWKVQSKPSEVTATTKNWLSSLTGIVFNDPVAYKSDKSNRQWNFHDYEFYNVLPSLFDACRTVSGGVVPVIFSRGSNECRGMFATELYKYIPTVSGEFQYTVNIGDFTYVNMDSNEDGRTEDTVKTGSVVIPNNDYASFGIADNFGDLSEISKYDCRIDPDQIKKNVDEYIWNIFGGYLRDGTDRVGTEKTDSGEKIKDKLVVISCFGLGTYDDRNGVFGNLFGDNMGAQWGRYLKQHGAVINLFSPKIKIDSTPDGKITEDCYKSLFDLGTNVNERKMVEVRSGGYVSVDDTETGAFYSVATSVLLSEEYAYVSSCVAYGTHKMNYDAANDVLSHTDGVSGYLYEEYNISLVTGEAITYSAQEPQLVGNTYYLSKPSHLVWLSEQVNANQNFSGKTFELKNDIDLMLKPFTPIGGYNDGAGGADTYSLNDYFAGTFNGNGYKVKNLHILPTDPYDTTDGNNETGFFGVVKGGTIKNLTIEGGFVKGGTNTGGLVGLVQSTSIRPELSQGGNSATITQCYTNVTIFGLGGTNSGANRIGGLVGEAAWTVTIDKCANYGNVYGNRSNGNVGGIVSSLYSMENASSTLPQYVGLITIKNCYNRGHIIQDGTEGHAGGIFGVSNRTYAVIKNCYNASAVFGRGKDGLIFGYTANVSQRRDDSGENVVSNCYAAKGFNGTTENYVSHVFDGVSIYQKSQSDMKSTTFDSTLNSSAYVDDGSINFQNGGSAGKINDGYPIHAGLIIYEEDKDLIKSQVTDATTDATNKVNEPVVPNVNAQFANGASNLTSLPDGTMYVLIQKADTLSSFYGSSGYANMSYSSASSFVWKLTVSGSNYTLTNVANTSTTKTGTFSFVGGSIADGSDSNTKDNLYNFTDIGNCYVFPLLQDNAEVNFGFTGKKDEGISSVISGLSVATSHTKYRDHGLADVKYNSVYGNNIFYYSTYSDTCTVIDTMGGNNVTLNNTAGRVHDIPSTIKGSYMTAPDATGQLMDMACDANFAWSISPSNNAKLELTYNGSATTFSTDGTSTANSRFFIAYSLNADGGYYLIPATNQSGKVLTVGTAETKLSGDSLNSSTGEVIIHDLVGESFMNTSRARFWIQANENKIVAEVVDVLARFDRNGKVIEGTVSVQEQTRFKNELYNDSSFYNPSGFWTDVYDNYVYAFDSVDVVSENNVVCYRYFRPIVVDVTLKSNLVSETYTDDSQGRDIRYYADSSLDKDLDGTSRFTDTFVISFNPNDGTIVDSFDYKYTLESWTCGSNTGKALTSTLSDITTITTDHQEITLVAEWSSDGYTLPTTSTRDKHVFYGWAADTTISSDSNLTSKINSNTATSDASKYPIKADTTYNAFWVGGDFAAVIEGRTDDDVADDTLNAVAAIYGAGTAKQTDNGFTNMHDNAEFKWYSVNESGISTEKTKETSNITGTYDSKYAPDDKLNGDDRGTAIRAQLYYNDTIVTGAYAYSALIPTNTLVDAVINTSTNEKEYFDKIDVVTSTTTFVKDVTQTFVASIDASEKIVSGVEISGEYPNATVKVYGILTVDGKRERILVVDNQTIVMYVDGGVSYEGIIFESYEVDITFPATTSVNKESFYVLVNPRIHKLTINDDNQDKANVQYLVNSYKEGERAKQASTQNRYFYADDQIRVLIPSADGFKLAAGTHFIIDGLRANENGSTVDNVKVFPTYTTTSTAGSSATSLDKVIVEKINGIDVILKKQAAGYIRFGTKDMTITVVGGTIDNAEKVDKDLYQNINIGPMGVKRTNDGTKKIRFGTIWYLDDLVTENRWYRAYTMEDQNAFGTYVIRLQKLFDNGTEQGDFYKFVAETKKETTLITTWNNDYASVTEEEKQRVLGYLKEFIAAWNEKADQDRVDKEMSFGTRENGSSVAAKVGADYYYYYKGDLSNGVREAMVEYSAVLEIPSEMENEEFIYIPYASYVYDWNYGYFANFEQYPQNIYVYSAPTAIYKYNGSN